MTVLAWLFFSVSAGLAAIYGIWQVTEPPGWARSFVKVGSVVALAGVAWMCGAPLGVVLALLASSVGDWLLSRPGEGAFLGGVAAFAVGHLAYVAVFLSLPGAGLGQVGIAGYFVAWGILILGLAMAVILWPRVGALRGPVMGYIVIILCMGWAALLMPASGGWALIVPAALLFVASDTALAVERFVLGPAHRSGPGLARFVWASYWGAQALFTLAFCLSPYLLR